jgi:hypothetical protein
MEANLSEKKPIEGNQYVRNEQAAVEMIRVTED